jgi:hypothetical protein
MSPCLGSSIQFVPTPTRYVAPRAGEESTNVLARVVPMGGAVM